MSVEIKDYLRNLIVNSTSSYEETVYEQAVRYGKIAYESFKIKLNDPNQEHTTWNDLDENERQAWICVVSQIEKLILKDNE